MSLGRFVSTSAAALAVGGCAAVVVAMGGAGNPTERPTPQPSDVAAPFATIPATIPLTGVSMPSESTPTPASTAAAVSTSSSAVPSPTPVTSPTSSVIRSYAAVPSPTVSTVVVPSTHAPAPQVTSTTPAPVKGGRLPLGYSTGTATRVITVVATSAAHTTATLQAWNKAPGCGWLKYGPAITAHIGADGMSSAPSEFRSATPEGSFSLTQAFGYYSNPGTGLAYFKTSPADWWISQSGPLYNTHQHCSSNCAFTQGSPNEHLYYETPYYDYAVVINTPSGASAYPHGSAFFLHVYPSGTGPTAGCVSIPISNLVTIMRWLTPAAHPRILIGVA